MARLHVPVNDTVAPHITWARAFVAREIGIPLALKGVNSADL